MAHQKKKMQPFFKKTGNGRNRFPFEFSELHVHLRDDGGAAGVGVPGTLLAVQVGQFLPKGGVLDALFQADGFHRRFLLIIHYVKSTSFRRRFPCAAVALAWIFVAKPIAPVYAGDKTGGERLP